MHEQLLRDLLIKQKENIDITRIDELVDHLSLVAEDQVHYGIGKVKESLATLLFGVFFGSLGVDMFYIGEKRRALRKLIPTIIMNVLNVVAFVLLMIVVTGLVGNTIPNNLMPPFIVSLSLFGVALLIGIYVTIYWILDMTEAYKLTQKNNTEMLLKL